ncbi:MAG: response regulator [Chloroflexota bacterium]
MSDKGSHVILVVEDSDEDFEATVRALRKVGPNIRVERCVDGDDALDFLNRRGSYKARSAENWPTLVLMDLNIPATDGYEVITHMRQDDALKLLPVVVLTTSSSPKDIERCYRAGVNSYMIKPVDFKAFVSSMEALYEYWFGFVVLPDQAGDTI